MFKFLSRLLLGQRRVNIAQRFDLIGKVGQGSMSHVFRAREKKTGQIVAVKILLPDKTAQLESRFVGLAKPSEGEVAVQLIHPRIVRTFEHGLTTNGEQFLVMEFIEGVALSYLVDLQNEGMVYHRLNFMVQLAEAIEYFHHQGWIHRDICPRNILIDKQYNLKLIDFGLVVPNTPEFQAPGNRTGTADYMAPELIKRLRTDQRIDIFSFGVTCFEMWTKRLPWEGARTLDAARQRLNAPPQALKTLVPNIDQRVAELIHRCIAVNPDDRYPTISHALFDLRQLQRQ